jgi:dephospho-CoA kinase
MLRVGLTGGIGSGKSTVGQRFRELGAVVIDADQVAREVVAVDSAGLGAIRQRFGDVVVAPDGSLDRRSLGEMVFADAQARKDLEAITHPLIGARTRTLMEVARPGQIVVHEVPLLAELDMGAAYHLTVVVGASEDVRMARLTGGRGFTETDARARIAAQADDGVRRAAADVWLDNNGSVERLAAQADELWRGRLVSFNENLVSRTAGRRPDIQILAQCDDSWPGVAARLIRRVALALGERAVAVEHIGSTSVPGLVTQEVIDLQVGVRGLEAADDPGFIGALADKGFPRSAGEDRRLEDVLSMVDDPALAGERLHGSADPGQIVRLYVRETGGRSWRYAVLLRDWLRAEAGERDGYAAIRNQLAQAATTAAPTAATPTAAIRAEYVVAMGQWLEGALARAEAWARHTGWPGP